MPNIPAHEFAKRKSKAEIRNKVMEMGRWTEFVQLRERNKEEGMVPEKAWVAAYEELCGAAAPADRVVAEVKQVESVSRPTRQSPDASKQLFEDKTCSTPKTVEWVAANLRISDASAEDAPSSEAWSMLCWVKSSPQAESQFWGQIYTKLLPTRQQLDQDTKMEDDGRRVLTLIDRIKDLANDD